MENNSNDKPNWFVRMSLIIFLLYLGALLSVSFIKSNPPYIISPTSITVLLIITVLVLSEAFQNLSIGTLLSLSRRVEEKKAENKELKDENRDLRESVVKIATSVSQSQVTANVSGIPMDWLGKMLGVTPARGTDIEEKQIEEVAKEAAQVAAQTSTEIVPEEQEVNRPKKPPFYKIRPILEEDAITRYLEKYQFPLNIVTREVQFTPVFRGLDPIMERRIVFDGYLKTPQSELFLEVNSIDFSPFFFDRLYVMLSKIMHYRDAKKIEAQLVLILTEFPSELELRRSDYRGMERLMRDFQPAFANGLLKVETIAFSSEDYNRLERLAFEKGN